MHVDPNDPLMWAAAIGILLFVGLVFFYLSRRALQLPTQKIPKPRKLLKIPLEELIDDLESLQEWIRDKQDHLSQLERIFTDKALLQRTAGIHTELYALYTRASALTQGESSAVSHLDAIREVARDTNAALRSVESLGDEGNLAAEVEARDKEIEDFEQRLTKLLALTERLIGLWERYEQVSAQVLILTQGETGAGAVYSKLDTLAKGIEAELGQVERVFNLRGVEELENRVRSIEGGVATLSSLYERVKAAGLSIPVHPSVKLNGGGQPTGAGGIGTVL